VQNPIREQIKLDSQWQTRPIDAETVGVFVPGAWAGREVTVQPAHGHAGTVEPGGWNALRLNETEGARLEAAHPLHITSLEASAANQRSLAVRLRLSAPDGAAVAGLLTIVLSLTATSGKLVGGTDLTVGARTRDLSVELPLPSPHGTYRLKAALCAGERVIDNARVDIHV
jgi:hypothetical protein